MQAASHIGTAGIWADIPKMGNAAALGLQCFWVWVLRGGSLLHPFVCRAPSASLAWRHKAAASLNAAQKRGGKKIIQK